MKPDSLRAEYVLTGGSFLMALGALFWAMERAGRDLGFTTASSSLTKDSPLVALGLLIGGAYVVGILCVQITFFFPTEGLIHVRRAQRLAELRVADAQMRTRQSPNPTRHGVVLEAAFGEVSDPDGESAWQLFRRPYRNKWVQLWSMVPGSSPIASATPSEPGSAATGATAVSRIDSLVLSLGRQLATDDVTREYEYRRSNRQVFVGVLPAVLVLIAAGLINPFSSVSWHEWTIRALVLLAGLLLMGILISSASYQEKVSQAQLLDTAFLHRWDGAG